MALKPPVEVPQGAIRLNTDSQKLEFFAQDQWWEMATDTPILDGGARGIVAGTANDVNTINFVNIAASGNATDFGDTTVVRGQAGGDSNSIRGVFAGAYGQSPAQYSNSMEYVTIATTGNATDFGDIPNISGNSSYTAGCSDSHGGIS